MKLHIGGIQVTKVVKKGQDNHKGMQRDRTSSQIQKKDECQDKRNQATQQAERIRYAPALLFLERQGNSVKTGMSKEKLRRIKAQTVWF